MYLHVYVYMCVQVRSLRQQLKKAEASEYELLRCILDIWRQLKVMRNEQGYSCTNLRLYCA